jgi:two-component system response regulator AtoC
MTFHTLPRDEKGLMQQQRVLVIDDEESLRHFLRLILEEHGYHVETAENGRSGLEALRSNATDIVLCDIRMPVMDGMAFLRELQEFKFDGTVIMMSAYGTIETAIEAMKLGAYDYVSKPFHADEIILTLRKAEEREQLRSENVRLREEVRREYSFDNIIASSHAMRQVFDLIRKVALYKSAVLVTGESGTGKELVARAIHHNSDRNKFPLVTINCGAIPDNLLESELFGHEEGAFTDAVSAKRGLFEVADGGSIFLDEVAELPQHLQVKLLRALQDGEIRRVGSAMSARVDVRVIAATARNLPTEIRNGRFREDLYYRLNVVHIHLPPLRERTEDIPLLIEHFIDKFGRNERKEVQGVTRDALERLLEYPWPGNVRELENTLERAMVLTEREAICLDDLPDTIRHAERVATHAPGLSLKRHGRVMEIELIKQALGKTLGNRVQAARLLEISRVALLQKIRMYGLEDYGKM